MKQDWQNNLNRYTNHYTTTATHPAEYFARQIIQLVNISSSLFVSQEARFVVKQNLLTILRIESQNQDKEKRIFKYKKIVKLFSSYIIKRKNILFHPDNQLLAWVDLDQPLGLVLGRILRLHRSQASNLLRDQLIPISTEPELRLLTEHGTLTAQVSIVRPNPIAY